MCLRINVQTSTVQTSTGQQRRRQPVCTSSGICIAVQARAWVRMHMAMHGACGASPHRRMFQVCRKRVNDVASAPRQTAALGVMHGRQAHAHRRARRPNRVVLLLGAPPPYI